MVTLVIEGGASRAAYATGVAWALQDAGLEPDAIYGTSAGAAIAAWYAAGQMHVGARTWDRVTDRDLLSFRRLVTRVRPVLDFEKLYHEVYPTQFGMDVGRLRAAPYPVVATLCDAETGESVYVDMRKAKSVWNVLHATSAMPFVSASPVAVGDRRFVDGGVSDPLPVGKALAEGHRDLIVVANRPAGARRPEPEALLRLVRNAFPALETPTRERHARYARSLALAERPPPGVRVTLVRPARDLGVSRFTRDVAMLREAVATGRRDGRAAIVARQPYAPA